MRHRHRPVAIGAVPLVAWLLSFSPGTAQTGGDFGDSLPGLPTWAIASFQRGRATFTTVETPATGLGPVYNGASCAECHARPVAGGSGESADHRTVRFGRITEAQRFEPLLQLGGPDLQRRSVADELPACRLAPETIPPVANVVGQRQPPPLFGLGLIEAIPETAILANADPDDADGDGIAGRANINAGVVGRFGWKAGVPTLLHFVGLAMVTELGVTNHVFPNEIPPQGGAIPPGCKLTPDIEDADASRLAGHLVFLKLLGPPPRGPITDAVVRGEAVFAQIGCTRCHVPAMRTGPNLLEALDQRDVPLYSDLLIHFMGGELSDGITEGAAPGGWWRTAPLWGLRARLFLLHDGRTSDLVSAIRAHDGEARVVRERFLALPPVQQADVLAFLGSL
jgi:CxxC motif-containing protein (DUF1111 family)